MKKLTTLIFILLIMFSLYGCNSSENAEFNSAIEELTNMNVQLSEELADLNEKILDFYNCEEEITNLSNEITELKSINSFLKSEINDSRELEITDVSLYKLNLSNYSSVISEYIFETNRIDFNLEIDCVSDFKVSNNNWYIAISTQDKLDNDTQILHIYNHDGVGIYMYLKEDLTDKVLSDYYDGSEVIILDGFSRNDEYLWGRLSSSLEGILTFSINLTTGELIMYSNDNKEEYQLLLEEYPISDF